jgi:hypothetical protein
MGKFGFSKKEKSEVADDGDSSRSGLFGRKKPTPSQGDNPYAQQPAEDPYARMTPYQQARANLAAGPRGPPAGLPSGPSPSNAYGAPPPAYPGSPQVSGGYTSEKLGASGGYGGNRYDAGGPGYMAGRTGPSPAPSQGTGRFPARGPGGYGGLGPTEDDNNKDELFAGAKGRFVGQAPAQPSYQPGMSALPGGPGNEAGGYGSSSAYGEQRELTEEEIEQQEVRGIKKQIQDVRDQSVQSSTNAAMALDNMIGVGRGTLTRLGQQGDMLHNTEKNLDLASNQSRVAEEKIGELKTLNRSMFAVHVSNPFTSKSRQAQREQQILDTHRFEQEQREQTRREAFQATQQMESTFKDLSRSTPVSFGSTNKSSSGRSKYTVDDDSDDEAAGLAEMGEEQIERNLDHLAANMPVAMKIAKAMGAEVERQNNIIDRIGEKVRFPSNSDLSPEKCTDIFRRAMVSIAVSRSANTGWRTSDSQPNGLCMCVFVED